MNKRKKILLGVGGAALVATLYFLYEHFTYVTTDNAQVEAHVVMLAPKVAGYVNNVSAQEGQRVKKGDVLIEIDSRDYENALTTAQGEVTSLEARRKEADRTFQRLQQLYKSGAVSQQQFDAANASHSEVRAKYDAAAAQASQAQLNLENTKIRAPSDGFIAKKSVEVGQMAAVGVPLLGFVDAGERWVTANFKETDIAALRIGAEVFIDVDAIPGHIFTGKVESVSSATGATFTLLPPDNATGNFTKVVQRVPVKILFTGLGENDKELLRAGLSSFVKVRR